ncbi:MAG: ATP-binding cassette domain-containing protein, partial [Acidimicrobiales bacterium]
MTRARPVPARRGLPGVCLVLGALVTVYLAVPVVAYLVRLTHPRGAGFAQPGLWSALGVSVVGATISLALAALTGVPLAYVLARRRGWLASLVGVAVQLPLAVPPLMGGILLIAIVGPFSFLGQLSGQRLTQTLWGVVLAQTFVSAPFLVVAARASFRSVDPDLDDVAATLGHGRGARFLRVAVPAAAEGIRAGMVLTWLRAFGEYGATVVLAYHPYTLPVYTDVQFSSSPLATTEAPTALALAAAIVAVAAGRLRRPGFVRRAPHTAPAAPTAATPTPVSFRLQASVGVFTLDAAHEPSGHRLAILGPSGSGKTMLLRSLAGVLPEAAGTIRFGGRDVSAVPARHRRAGYLPQGYALLRGRTVWEEVTAGVHTDPRRAAWWLDRLHLGALGDRPVEQLSGGQRQRVGLARALACDPSVVLLDEPFSAIDPPVRAELRRELRRLQREVGLSTILVTHDPEEAALLADDLLVLAGGRVLQVGRVRAVFDRPASPEVARLLGIANVFPGEAAAGAALCTPAGAVPADTGHPPGTPLLWRVAPEALAVVRPGDDLGGGWLLLGEGEVVDVADVGRAVETLVVVGGME